MSRLRWNDSTKKFQYAPTEPPSFVDITGSGATVEFPAGMLLMFAGAAAPTGYLLCDGAAVSRTTYAALFAVIGETYGAGDSVTTFNLPDMRGRSPIGVGQGAGLTLRNLADQVGNETHQLTTGELPAHSHSVTDTGHTHVMNAHNHTITDAGHTHTMDAHNHTTVAHSHGITDPGHAHGIEGSSATFGGTGNGPTPSTESNDLSTSNTTGITINNAGVTVNNATSTMQSQTTGITVDNATSTMQSQTTGISLGNTGSDTAHNNMQPSLAVNFIIKT